MAKKLYQVTTPALMSHYSLAEQGALFSAFQTLVRAFPKEYHFSIGLLSADHGQGEKVWFIVDESEAERIETMLLPSDY